MNVIDQQNLTDYNSNKANFVIILAKESPSHQVQVPSDSEPSWYSSIHDRDTDICRDTSDTETTISTDGEEKGLQVLEYDVASPSICEDLYSHDSSTGTDDYIVTAALAHAMFNSSSTEYVDIWADTEESDGPTDPELGRADYWTCVKCKNHQNNPMYRYCEKCYQIRKTHFPPRPKHRKKRRTRHSKQLKRLADRLSEDDSANDVKRPANGSTINRHRTGTVRNGKNGDSSTGNKCKRSSVTHTKYRNSSYYKSISEVRNNSDGELNSRSDCSDSYGSLKEAESRIVNKSSHRLSKIRRRIDESDSDEYLDGVSRPKKMKLLDNLKGSLDSGYYADSQATYCPNINGSPSNLPSSQETVLPNTQFSDLTDQVFTMDSIVSSECDDTLVETGNTKLVDDTFVSGLEQQSSNLSDRTISTTVVSDLSTYSGQLSNNDFLSLDEDDELDEDPNQKFKNRSTSPLLIYPNTLKSNLSDATDSTIGNCIICLTEPKNGVFVHSRFLHLCCCYRCAVKVWNQRKQCPICNCKIKTVMKLFVH